MIRPSPVMSYLFVALAALLLVNEAMSQPTASEVREFDRLSATMTPEEETAFWDAVGPDNERAIMDWMAEQMRLEQTPYCYKKVYGRGAGFPWEFGDSLDDSAMFRRCEAKHGQGNCEKWGLVVYPKCEPGYRNVACCICEQICTASQPTDCGAGCTWDTDTCVEKTAWMVADTGFFVWNAVSFSGAFQKAGVAGASAAQKAAQEATEVAFRSGATQAQKQAAKVAVTKAAQLIAKGLARTIPQRLLVALKKRMLKKSMLFVLKRFARHMVAQEVMRTVPMAHEGSTGAEDWDTHLMADLTMLDPTGISAVVKAFDKPLCSFTPFPVDVDKLLEQQRWRVKNLEHYVRVPRMAIRGHNHMRFNDKTPLECAQLCSNQSVMASVGGVTQEVGQQLYENLLGVKTSDPSYPRVCHSFDYVFEERVCHLSFTSPWDTSDFKPTGNVDLYARWSPAGHAKGRRHGPIKVEHFGVEQCLTKDGDGARLSACNGGIDQEWIRTPLGKADGKLATKYTDPVLATVSARDLRCLTPGTGGADFWLRPCRPGMQSVSDVTTLTNIAKGAAIRELREAGARELRENFQLVPNSAIRGHNLVRLKGTPEECAEACARRGGGCRSFDYIKGTGECDLSLASPWAVKTGYYKHGAYDHYAKVVSEVSAQQVLTHPEGGEKGCLTALGDKVAWNSCDGGPGQRWVAAGWSAAKGVSAPAALQAGSPILVSAVDMRCLTAAASGGKGFSLQTCGVDDATAGRQVGPFDLRGVGTPVRLVNVAEGKAASQSSTSAGGVASRAVDGNTNGHYSTGSVSHTGAGPSHWQVDLGQEYPVRSVTLHNRTDCCAERLNDFTVDVKGSAGDNGDYLRLSPVMTKFEPGPRTFRASHRGPIRYIRVISYNTDPLQLAEVVAEVLYQGKSLE